MELWVVGRVALAFAVIAAVLAGLRVILARVARVRIAIGGGQGRSLELIETLPLPHETALAVVRIGRHRHVIALGHGTATPVCELPPD
jgi:hypothetical protein